MWKLLYKRATSRGRYRPTQKMLVRKAKRWKFPINNIHCADLSKIKNGLEEAVTNYKKIKKDAKQLRLTFLEDKAAAIADELGIDKDRYLKHLIHIEEVRDTAIKIRYMQNTSNNGPLHYVEEGSDAGPRQRITDKEGMEILIRTANIKKLTQANNTPLREEPLQTFLGESTLNFEKWETAMDPNATLPTGLDKGTRMWFEQMRNHETTITPEPVRFNTDTYRNSWKPIKEKTSSHPGLHFGHLKAMDDSTPLANQLHATLADIPLQTGYSPEEWRKCTNAMIKKKQNDM